MSNSLIPKCDTGNRPIPKEERKNGRLTDSRQFVHRGHISHDKLLEYVEKLTTRQ